MSIKLTKWSVSVAAITLATSMIVANAGEAFATQIYSGGATFPENFYREIFNCYMDDGAGSLGTVDVGCPQTRNDVQALYAGTGSGNGKKAWRTKDTTVAQFMSGGRNPSGPDCNPIPYSSTDGPYYNDSGAPGGQPADGETSCAGGTFRGTGPAFPHFHFAGSDDPLVPGDLTVYNPNSAAGGWGAAIQVPAFIGGTAIAYNPASGGGVVWTEKGKKASGGTSFVDLSRETYCGIFSGHITDWNDSHITADNKGISITGGVSSPIEVVVRSDGSGTTFLFTNGVLHQCGSASHPSHGIAAGMAFEDSWISDNGLNPVTFDPNDNVNFQSNNNFYINIAPAHVPAAMHLTKKPGNGGIESYASVTPGTIAYLSGDFVKPVAGRTLATANLQEWDNVLAIEAGATTTKKWVAITPKTVSKIMSTTVPPVFTAGCVSNCATNPLDWGKSNPFPTSSSTYPLGGFTFFDMYTCYGSATDKDALFGQTAGHLGFFRWYYGSTTENAGLPKAILSADSFGVLPGKWIGAIKKLVFKNKPTMIGTPGQANTGCASVAGAGA